MRCGRLPHDGPGHEGRHGGCRQGQDEMVYSHLHSYSVSLFLSFSLSLFLSLTQLFLVGWFVGSIEDPIVVFHFRILVVV